MLAGLPPPLAVLSALDEVAGGQTHYYRQLTAIPDEHVQVGAWCALIEAGDVSDTDLDSLLRLAGHGAIRRRAFVHFNTIFERKAANRIAEVTPLDPLPPEERLMRATVQGDQQALHEAQVARFLADGDIKALRQAADSADAAGGWQAAIAWFARVVALNPTDQDNAAALAYLLEGANHPELLTACLDAMEQSSRLEPVAALFRASQSLQDGDAKACLDAIERLEERGRTGPQKFGIGALGAQIKARALARAGRFADALGAYTAMHGADAGAFAKHGGFIEAARSRNRLPLPEVAPAGRPGHVIMLGFPRSGTTLLENALAAHPAVETFEEVASLEAAWTLIERAAAGKSSVSGGTEVLLEARERYFGEFDRLSRKPSAHVRIDKMPIRSANAPFIRRLIPDQRFIFSIRHPYDVALSCFQQRFRPNAAMANFLRFDSTVALYDFAMTTWFGTYGLEDERVHYVRYNQLVPHFEEKLRDTLDFLGLDWDPAVLDFAERATQRGSKTPSYRKVRQGLSIGVQSQWKNYVFLFRQKGAAPLTRWAKFFGYETV